MKLLDHLRKPGDICRFSPDMVFILDNTMRRIFQNPEKILGEYVRPGMTAIDLGCGPGMFTLAMAKMVGESRRVIAVDVQQEMPEILKDKEHKNGTRRPDQVPPEYYRTDRASGKGRLHSLFLHGTRSFRPGQVLP